VKDYRQKCPWLGLQLRTVGQWTKKGLKKRSKRNTILTNKKRDIEERKEKRSKTKKIETKQN